MNLLAAAVPIPATSTLLSIAALLACFVAGLYARSILEHELDLFRRARLGQDVTRANQLYRDRPRTGPASRPQPLPPDESNWHDPSLAATQPFRPITRDDLEQAERDAELPTLVAGGWPARANVR